MESQSNTNKTIRGISSQTIVTIMLGIVEISSFSIMSRLLTAEDFGYYAALSAILIVFNSFAETGIGSAIIQRKNINQKFINNAFTLALSLGLLVSFVLFILSDYLAKFVVNESMSLPLKLMSLTLLCQSMTSPYVSTLQRNLKFMTIGYVNLISLIITTSIAILLAYKGFGYYAIIAKTILNSILTLIFVVIISKVKFSIEWDKGIIKSIWNYSGWLLASVVFRNFSQQADRLLMSNFLSVEVLGFYNRPKEFINQISTKINGIFDTALFPVLSGIQDDIKRLQQSLTKSIYLLNIFSSVLSVTFFFNAEFIIRIFFGSEWLHLSGILQVLSLAVIFNVDGRLADCFLRSLGLTKAQFLFRIAETIIKFSGVIVGAKYGVYGVAIAVVFVNFIMIFMKLGYIASNLQSSYFELFITILRSWKSMSIIIPMCVMMSMFFPHNLQSNIVQFVIFVFVLGIVFLVLPSLVGMQYKNGVHKAIINQIKKRTKWKF